MDSRILSGKKTISLGIQCNLSAFNKESHENQVSITTNNSTNKCEYFIAETEIADIRLNPEIKREVKVIKCIDQEQQTESNFSIEYIKGTLEDYNNQLSLLSKDNHNVQLRGLLDSLYCLLNTPSFYQKVDCKELLNLLEKINKANNDRLYELQCSRLPTVIANLLKQVNLQLIQKEELNPLVKQEAVLITADHIKEIFTEIQDCFTVIHFIYKTEEQIAAEFLCDTTTTLENIYLTCSTANTRAKAELRLIIDKVTNDQSFIDLDLLLKAITTNLTAILKQYKIEMQQLALLEVAKIDFSSTLKTNEVVNLYLFCLALQFYASLKNLNFENNTNQYDSVKSILQEIKDCLEVASINYQISHTTQLIKLFKVWFENESIKDLQEFADEALSPFIVNQIGLIYNNLVDSHLETKVLAQFQSLAVWSSFFQIWDINQEMQELEQFEEDTKNI